MRSLLPLPSCLHTPRPRLPSGNNSYVPQMWTSSLLGSPGQLGMVCWVHPEEYNKADRDANTFGQKREIVDGHPPKKRNRNTRVLEMHISPIMM